MTVSLRQILLCSVFSAALVLTGCDKPKTDKKLEKEISAVEKESHSYVLSPSVAGNYLAGRFAVGNDDLDAATQFYEFAIESSSADKDFLIERALPTAIGSGNFDKALELAKQVDVKKPLATSQLALTVLLVDAFNKNDIDAIKRYLPDLRTDGFGKLLKPLMEVWLSAAEKNDKQALSQLQQLSKEYTTLGPLTQMHTAFVYDMTGNIEGAERFYAKTLDAQASVRSAWLVAQFYERQKQTEKAIALYEGLADKMQGSPFAQLVVKRLKDGDVEAESFIKQPRDGVAAALYDVATVLHQESSYRLALLYAQLAHVMVPDDPFVNMLLGDIVAGSNVSSGAEKYYNNVSKESDFWVLAQLRLAQFYEGNGDIDKSIDILETLGRDPLVKRQAMTEIGDIYRRKEDFDNAVPYYTKAIETIKDPVESDWVLYYARGICFEREKDWDKAEADLQEALKLSPQQPEVLNYLAYSWADSGKNLDRALEMLQNALAGAPDDPYITDSVGWALYKTGRFNDAVPYLEAAVQALPADPTINDHLGDIYWRVGRKLEAKFQWERALKNATEKDAELKVQIEEKMDNGMPNLLLPLETKTDEAVKQKAEAPVVEEKAPEKNDKKSEEKPKEKTTLKPIEKTDGKKDADPKPKTEAGEKN